MSTRSGYVSIIGKPNVGKSTLLNELLEKKISITADKSQTTRNNIMGIKTHGETQIIFLDTPGIHSKNCLLYTSPSPRDKRQSRMPSSA